MNPSTALARVLVDELVRCGVREAVLAPGSRSAPLAFALHDADAAGRLRLHVRIDERSASFLALGLAKRSGVAVPVVTTSGTATANLHPAVLEAAEAGVPLLVLTADRPPELRGTGANQTIDQVKLYGDAVRLFVEVGAPEERAGQNAYWRSLACRATAVATGVLDGRPGPVHLNLALREPLVPDDEGTWPEPLTGRADGQPWTAVVAPEPVAVDDDLPARTVVVLGDAGEAEAAAAVALAESRGWPVVAEPSGQPPGSDVVVPAAELLLGVPEFVTTHVPDRVLVVGRSTLSRPVGRFVASGPCDVVAQRGSWADPPRQAHRVLPTVPRPGDGPSDPDWLPGWQQAGKRAATAVDTVLDALPGLPEPVVASEVVAALQPDALLVVGSSKPVRDLFRAGTRGARVLANRGVAGIDGMVSTAVGAALAHQRSGGGPSYALLGDLTFLHDANGLVLGPDEARPDLTIVVVNNDGGAIFGLLEPAGTAAFERVFGTPHGVDLEALCAATHTSYQEVASREELRAALRAAPGIRVIEVRTDRQSALDVDRAVRAAVTG